MCGGNAVAPVAAPTLAPLVVVLHATNTPHGIGDHQDKRLVVRLTDNGQMEWDDWSPQNGGSGKRIL
jgi:hypothetical protein